MTNTIRISLDAMGGDHGSATVVSGAAISRERHPELSFLMFGDEAVVRPLVEAEPRLKGAVEIRHTTLSVAMDEKPSQAVRSGRGKSSMWKAIQAVKDGEAHAAVSAGNTGALMAMAKICLKTMAGIERPAIACLWPTVRGESVVLDVGATIGTDAEHLVEMAVMGSAMARIVLDIEKPTVGLLNVGTEEMKGNEAVKEAARLLRETELSNFSYFGFVEGNDLGRGTVDVVVTEGFTGNIALKTAEGTARQVKAYMKSAMTRTLSAKIGAFLARKAFKELKDKMDPSRANGGVFLGLEGIVVKSHGSEDTQGFAAAVDLAFDMARYDLMRTTREMLEHTPAVAPV